MHATAYLKSPEKHAPGPAVALFGAEHYLKQRALETVCKQVLGDDADEMSLSRFPGKGTELATVLDELNTVSMWGDKRVVVIEDADDFVKAFRPALEKYLDKPARKAVLVIDAKTWPSTTRLAKKIAEIGLSVECAPLKPADLVRWLGEHCLAAHGKQLGREAGQTLVELAGNEIGLIDQELAKLAAFVGEKKEIDAQAVRSLVGGWRAETTWSMLDAVRDGKPGTALALFDKLLSAGEHPLKLLGGIHYTFRPMAQATETARHGMQLRDALVKAGVKPFNIDAAINYLRRIGRPKAELLFTWLMEADSGLKGGSSLPERLIVEQLLLQLAGKV
jgi:DNA polymerase-3 subunit delta